MKKPMIPDIPNQNQLSKVASIGKKVPRVNSVVKPKKMMAKNMRMIFTESDPTLCPAF